jgi:hypothetical protein
MSVTAVVVHRLPHRIRLRLPEKRHDASFFSALISKVQEINGVTSTKANPATGSLLLEFSCSTDELVDRLREHDVSVVLQTIQRGATPRTGSVELHRQLPIPIVTGRNINPMFMAGAAFALIGAIQAIRGRILIPSATALWYASEAFLRSTRSKSR